VWTTNNVPFTKKWERLVCANNTMRMQVESKDKLVVNISSTQLSDTQVNFLSKGLNFAFVPERVPIFDIIKSVESASFKLAPEKLHEFKAQIKKAIMTHKIHDSNLSNEEKCALEELRENKNIIISKADKGNIVVVQDSVIRRKNASFTGHN
jgi:hypothetical protein